MGKAKGKSPKEVVVVRPINIESRYHISAEKKIEYLRSLNLMPLTVDKLSYGVGPYLLNLATWVEMSGHLIKDECCPSIADDDQDFLDFLVEEEFGNFFSFRRDKTRISMNKDSGLWGKTLAAMGVSKAEDSGDLTYKAHYVDSLPKYVHDIMSVSDEYPVRERLLSRIASILVKDRFRNRSPNGYLALNNFKTRERAIKYAKQVVELFNEAFSSYREMYGENMFRKGDIKIRWNRQKRLYTAEILLDDTQIGYLARPVNDALVITPRIHK